MGDRVNFEFQAKQGTITLYSHWGGDTSVNDLADALLRARGRWSDDSYATRIVVSQIIGGAWDSETGYGLISGSNGEEENPTLVINWQTGEVNGVALDLFCLLHARPERVSV